MGDLGLSLEETCEEVLAARGLREISPGSDCRTAGEDGHRAVRADLPALQHPAFRRKQSDKKKWCLALAEEEEDEEGRK